MRPFLLLAALLVTGAAQAEFDSNTQNGDIPGMDPPKKMSRSTPMILCAPPAAAAAGKVLRYREGYRMQVVGVVSDEAIAAANALGVALAFVGAGHVTYCRGNTVRVRAVPVPGYPAPPQYEPEPSQPAPSQPAPSAPNGSRDVLPEQREVAE